MSKTDTNVVVTQYPASFSRRPAKSTIDFTGNKHWRIDGHWFNREIIPRRRRWTMVRDILRAPDFAAVDITVMLKETQPGIFMDLIDKDARALLCYGQPNIIMIVEEVKR